MPQGTIPARLCAAVLLASLAACAGDHDAIEPSAPVATVPSAEPPPPPPAPSPSSPAEPPAPAEAAPPLATAAPGGPEAPSPGAGAGASIFGQPLSANVTSIVEAKIDAKGVKKFSLRASGSCEGDCALGPNTVLSLAMEQQPRAVQGCFPRATKQSFALKVAIDPRGKVLDVAAEGPDARSAEARCVARVLRSASLPPGSDPSSRIVLRFEIEQSGP